MSGLVKAKKYDWKDSNMALFGSDTEKQVKKESAEQEPAWQGAGAEEGLKIWRIEQFEVKEWNEKGKFYNGDSYIILNTYKDDESDQLLFDVHFWIGKNSTQDEYGTAAYKTVELDTFLDDAAVQHREVQGHESELFRSYFPSLVTMEGGAASGFNHVTPEEYKPRLLKINGKRSNLSIREVPLSKNSVNSNDIFILDLGEKFIQFNGSNSNLSEKTKAMQVQAELKSERATSDYTIVEEGDGDSEFFSQLSEDEVDGDSDDEDSGEGEKSLHRLSDGAFEQIKTEDISIDDFQSDDVFILDAPNGLFVWVGSNASPDEKKNGLPRAHQYLANTDRFSFPVTVIKEGQKSQDFLTAIAA